MIECYYLQCPHHDKDEPYCSRQINCTASVKELVYYQKCRDHYLKTGKIIKEPYNEQMG